MSKLNKSVINKYVEFASTKAKILYSEKKFDSNGYTLKYLFEKNKSDDLIVVLSGFARPQVGARYNYNRTLGNVKANKLFILDNFGHDELGAYYLGKNKDFKIQLAVKELIKMIKKENNIKNTIYAGSSKGGYGAFYFGLQEEEATIIAGAPQYYLGDFLYDSPGFRKNTLSYIMGDDFTDEDVETLNYLLRDLIRSNSHKNHKIFLHYSEEESTYRKHVRFLIEELEENNIPYEKDVHDYKDHNDVSLHFPDYLFKTAKNITSK